MAIPTEIQDYITTQLDYYTDEVDTYLLVAKEHCDTDSLEDTVFGIILGCVYLGFIQVYQAQFLSINATDVAELHDIINKREKSIRLAIQGSCQRHQTQP